MESELEKIAFVYGDVCVRRKRRKRQKLIVIELIFDYFKNSTLHGLRYIAERGLSIIERLFWFFTFMASATLCLFLIYNTYVKWKTSPVVVTVNGQLASVETVPFPAVTIYPETKVKLSVYNYTAEFKKVSKLYNIKSKIAADIIHKFENIHSLCDSKETPKGYKLSNYTKHLVKDITEVALTPTDVFFGCIWHDKTIPCTNLFHQVYTEQGVCYTSNNLAASDVFTDNIQKDYPYLESNDPIVGWSADTGEYTNYSIVSPYPRRGRVYGSDPDMMIYLTADPNFNNKDCNTLYTGYKIFLHHPMDLPTSSLYYYAALPGQTSTVAISFHHLNTDIQMLTSKTFKYPSEIRQCYFQSERPLRYFKLYTASNCRAECLSNYTYNMCKCVAFYMPHHNSSEICSGSMKNCIKRARAYMAMKERSAEHGLENKDEACLCRPSCDSIEYDAEILKTEFHLAESFKASLAKQHKIDTIRNVRFSQVVLFFKKPHFVTMQRREMFGITDFLADIGGLMGLFLGFSFISLVEIFYFLTLRVGIKLKRDLREEKRQKKMYRSGKK